MVKETQETQVSTTSRALTTSHTDAALIPEQDWSLANPQTVVRILVDTARVAAMGGGAISSGAKMFDNRADNGSLGEGGLRLVTAAKLEDYIGFYIAPLNPNLGDQVSIYAFYVLSGDAFAGNSGRPKQQVYEYWAGQILNASDSTYKITCSLTSSGLGGNQWFFDLDYPSIIVR